MKNKEKYKFLANAAIGFVLGIYIVFIMLDEKGIFEGSNKAVSFTIFFSLVALSFLRVLISKASSD